jgi:DNA-binding NarL/FixJ family response regulator
VAIIDVRMPPTHADEGLRAAKAIRQDFPEVGVLVFSQYIEAGAAAELFASAPTGVGYLLKDRVADVSDFIDAITRMRPSSGGAYLRRTFLITGAPAQRRRMHASSEFCPTIHPGNAASPHGRRISCALPARPAHWAVTPRQE